MQTFHQQACDRGARRARTGSRKDHRRASSAIGSDSTPEMTAPSRPVHHFCRRPTPPTNDLATPTGVAALVADAPGADILVNRLGMAFLRDYRSINVIAAMSNENWLDLSYFNPMSGAGASRQHLPRMVVKGLFVVHQKAQFY